MRFDTKIPLSNAVLVRLQCPDYEEEWTVVESKRIENDTKVQIYCTPHKFYSHFHVRISKIKYLCSIR